jgi:hypothetical protein
MTIIISILSVLVILLLYTNYNLLKKNEKCEDIIITYERYMVNLSNTIKDSDKRLKEVDRKGSFESDDEVGFFFITLKEIQDQLNNFKVN